MPSSAEILRDYLLSRYKNVKIFGPEKKAWRTVKSDAILGSESVVYVNDSVIHPNNRGWYDLSQDDYNKLVSRPRHYYAVMLEKDPEHTFVIPGSKLETFFAHVEPNLKQDKLQWDFSIIERNGSHNTLKVNRDPTKDHPLGDLLNRWDQIDEFNNQLVIIRGDRTSRSDLEPEPPDSEVNPPTAEEPITKSWASSQSKTSKQ